MIDIIPLLILTPLLWASLAFLFGPVWGARQAIAGITLQVVLAVMLAENVSGGALRTHAAGGWEAPLGITLSADGLGATMLLLTQVVALPLAFYAEAYFSRHRDGSDTFWPLAGYLLAGMNALFLSADVFNLYVTLELVGLAAVGLVASGGSAHSVAAALRYLFATLLGSGAYLLGVALLYAAYGTVSLAELTSLVSEAAPTATLLAALLMLTGMAIKTALFPFHFWLPPAHGGAPAPVSALLSALVIKASFYLAVRLWLTLFLPLVTPVSAQLFGVLGAAAICWGSVIALRQTRLKMLIAYSTVAQIGYLFLFFPLATDTAPDAVQSALQGVTLHAFSHGFAKAAMFAAAGAVILSTGHDRIGQLGGISAHMPLTVFTLAIAGVSLMGLPPSAGFLAKWLLIDSAIASGQWWWILVMIAGGLLTAAYVFKVLRHAFLRAEQSVTFRPLPRMAEWPAFLLALASLALGGRATEVLNLLGAP
ncbi:MAG TPA: proton-conducting transporter membrane subunit [Noviherbaspirillum sp.]|uniref:complex I subunit 5 family protein n=1 Tax=Noviherbaspirillum sp. TaxID=1926288 RepID=UPI002D58E3EE|nr:proton-conducting transporter membrane subunit [Noviherbaspirillum sp.]HYD96252.1 proton-conducting transporter membrane subunit [Noviherbaspirillum sp.]